MVSPFWRVWFYGWCVSMLGFAVVMAVGALDGFDAPFRILMALLNFGEPVPITPLFTNLFIMSEGHQQKERFAPKQPVELAAPKDDVITREYLSKCDGTLYCIQDAVNIILLTME